MDPKSSITIYVDNKAYTFDVGIHHGDRGTTYEVKQKEDTPQHLDLLPYSFKLTEDGRINSGDGIDSVEQKQLVRLIWQEISTNTKGR